MAFPRLFLLAVLAWAVHGAALAAQPQAPSVTLDIKAQPLGDALNEFGRQAGLQVVLFSAIGEGITSPRLSGNYSPQAALDRLLENTSLSYEFINARTVAIRVPKASSSGAISSTSSTAASAAPLQLAVARREAQPQARTDNQSTDDQSSGSNKTSGESLQEIIVTAQKRGEQRLQDVPMSISVVRSESLINSNLVRLQDYYMRIPGVNLVGNPRNASGIALRGIHSGVTNPTVGISIDDVPFGSSTTLGGGSPAPELDPNALSQIEVLRGPQGTLYGANSMGGLLRFVTTTPSLDRLSGQVQVGVNDVQHGDGAGANVRASVNVPVSQTWAVQASGFKRHEPGYIDNHVLGDPTRVERGVNDIDADGGRLAALWRPSENFSLKLSALLQNNEAHGAAGAFVRSDLGELEQNALRGSGWIDRKFELYSANMAVKLGSAELTAITGYGISDMTGALDGGPALSPLAATYFGVSGSQIFENNETKKFSQEVRLASANGAKLEWLLGAFYTHEDSTYLQRADAVNPLTLAVAGVFLGSDWKTKYEEYAAFASLTYHFTDRFDVQLGGRESKNRQQYSSLRFAPPGSPQVRIPRVPSEDSSFTFMATPRLKISPQLMMYAQVASGYRPGGPNSGTASILGLPPTFGPDKTLNYELGIKGELFDRALTFNGSIYNVDWDDIQLIILTTSPPGSYYTNVSKARSRGVEFSVEAKPTAGLTVAGWVAWNQAEFVEDLPASSPARASSGDRLPLSSRFSGNLSIDQQFSLGANMTALVGGVVSYVGDREGDFTANPALRLNFPAYTRVDARVAVERGTWTFNAFVNNIADKRGVLLGTPVSTYFTYNYIQPRTIGLSVAKSF